MFATTFLLVLMLNLVASSSAISRRLRLVHVIILSGSPYVLVSSISSTRVLMSGYVFSMLGLPAPRRRIASLSAGVLPSLLISRIPARTESAYLTGSFYSSISIPMSHTSRQQSFLSFIEILRHICENVS